MVFESIVVVIESTAMLSEWVVPPKFIAVPEVAVVSEFAVTPEFAVIPEPVMIPEPMVRVIVIEISVRVAVVIITRVPVVIPSTHIVTGAARHQ